ncbi:hypothetical protein [Microbispora sp. H10836]|uniref:hypothetical protein n=1 Tax=Microbispora sp. H10836 TaxID=2729106 RepID=UPI0014753927|nr:hypothetical protein [Microbispora sp. H10836]
MAPTQLYQVVLRDPGRPIWVRLHRVFSAWAQTKGFPPPDAGRARVEHEHAGARLVMERRAECGRYVLEEPLDGGRLRTRAVFLDGAPGWVQVTVEQEGDARRNARAPGFVPAYLRTARITDGGIHLVDRAEVLAEDEVHRFLRVLTEPRRRVPVVVVSPGHGDENTARADRLAEATAGAGVVVRLADRRTENLFNRLMGDELSVYGGAIRTYAAPFDPATERSPYRHPPMRPAKLREEGALETIADGVIGRASAAEPHPEVRQSLPVVLRVLAGRAEVAALEGAMTPPPAPVDPAREELRRKMMALTVRPAPPSPPSPQRSPAPPAAPPGAAEPEPVPGPAPEPVAVVDESPDPDVAHQVAEMVVKAMRQELDTALGLAAGADTSRDVLREVRTLGLHLAGLRELIVPAAPAGSEDDLRIAHELLREEYAETVTAARVLEERVRWLERTLAESGHPVYGIATPGEPFTPASLAETLVEARSRLAHLVVGQTDNAAVRLDHADPMLSRTWAAKAWDALLALDDFARARSSGEFAGGFYDWCADGSGGRRVIPPGMLAMRESASVTNSAKFSQPRTFPVPAEVHPSGKIVMEAHVKLRAVGYPAPRMYFHDDSGGVTGKIYVGYLGDHLPNTRTN